MKTFTAYIYPAGVNSPRRMLSIRADSSADAWAFARLQCNGGEMVTSVVEGDFSQADKEVTFYHGRVSPRTRLVLIHSEYDTHRQQLVAFDHITKIVQHDDRNCRIFLDDNTTIVVGSTLENLHRSMAEQLSPDPEEPAF
jgi:hypothetical protein